MEATVLPDDGLRDAPRGGQTRLAQAHLNERTLDYIREAKLDQMIADSFPASDPPSH